MLVIRGELLKRYPTAVIYAHRACWQRKAVDAGRQRQGSVPATVRGDRQHAGAPLRAAHRRPRRRSRRATKVLHAALRGQGRSGHLLLRLRPHGRRGQGRHRREPGRRSRLVLRDQGAAGRAALRPRHRAAGPRSRSGTTCRGRTIQPEPAGRLHRDRRRAGDHSRCQPIPATADEKYPQYADDKVVQWNRNTMSSAELAYILFQAPVLVAVHASEMLPK